MTVPHIHPRAAAEVAEATHWYAERSKVTARRFLDEIESALERMSKLPEVFPLVPTPSSAYTLRRVPLHRFPYSLIYTKTTVRLEVLSVAHMKRRPLYWIARLADVEDEPGW